MRKLVTWAVVTLGIAAVVRRLRRRNAAAAKELTADPAAELRRKIDETRAAETAIESPAPVEATVDDRRAEVHHHGRATLDEMRVTVDE